MEHPLEIIKKAALNGVLDYKASNTPEQIRIRVHQQLERIEQEVVLSLLGLTGKWGKIELDSNPDSPVRKKLIGQKELFIEEFFKDLDFTKLLTPTMKKQLFAEARRYFYECVDSSVRHLVRERASELAEEVAKELLPKIDVSKEIALLKLLGTENESHT